MYLVIARRDVALWINKERAIDRFIRGNPYRQRADVNVDTVPPRHVAQSCESTVRFFIRDHIKKLLAFGRQNVRHFRR